MYVNRRSFIKAAGSAGAGLLLHSLVPAFARGGNSSRLVILHTNDWHSRIDPFPLDGSKYAGLGGAARRAALIKSIRQEEEQVLLLDAGDVFQGTPYFNMYGGALEYKLMTEMGYDAMTLGNHDFDNGLEGIVRQMPLAGFDIVNANYDFTDTILAGKISPYRIVRKGKLKVGIIGVGIELKGLVPDGLCRNVIYQDPVAKANYWAAYLKNEEKCHLVICLSHLGYSYAGDKVSDLTLAAASEHIDLVIGGHTHTFLDAPVEVLNKAGKKVTVNQVGWGGMVLGRVDYEFVAGAPPSKPQSTMYKVS